MCFIYEYNLLNAKKIKWIGINNKALPQEYIDLIKRIDYEKGMLILRATRNLTKGIIEDVLEDDILLNAITKRLNEVKEVTICYETDEGDRAFKFEDCIYDHNEDDEETNYLYNGKNIYIKFKPVDHKTKISEEKLGEITI